MSVVRAHRKPGAPTSVERHRPLDLRDEKLHMPSQPAEESLHLHEFRRAGAPYLEADRVRLADRLRVDRRALCTGGPRSGHDALRVCALSLVS